MNQVSGSSFKDKLIAIPDKRFKGHPKDKKIWYKIKSIKNWIEQLNLRYNKHSVQIQNDDDFFTFDIDQANDIPPTRYNK